MDGEQLYFTLSQMNLKDKKATLATLTENQKLLYKRYSNKIRQQRFNEKPENKEKLNEHRKIYIAEKRKENPILFQQNNIKDVKAFREREKAKLKEINDKLKANEILTNAIKSRKAKKELINLKEAKTKEQKPKEAEKPKDDKRIKCQCGTTILKSNYARHLKSKSHFILLNK